MKNKAIVAVLLATMLMTACNTEPVTESAAPTTSATTTTEETTVEITTETTTEVTTETTETIIEVAYTDEMLHMSIDEVADAVLTAMGSGYERLPAKYAYNENNKSIGIVNVAVISGYTDDYGVEIYICEYDMESEEYIALLDNSSFDFYFVGCDVMGELALSAINKQYVIYVCTMPAEDGVITGTDGWVTEPPYSIGKAQEGYDAFVALT